MGLYNEYVFVTGVIWFLWIDSYKAKMRTRRELQPSVEMVNALQQQLVVVVAAVAA